MLFDLVSMVALLRFYFEEPTLNDDVGDMSRQAKPDLIVQTVVAEPQIRYEASVGPHGSGPDMT